MQLFAALLFLKAKHYANKRKKKTIKKAILLVLLLIFTLTSCATIMRGTEQGVHINTHPVGAKLISQTD